MTTLFGVAFGDEHEVGMDTACSRLGVAFEGTHHRGIDDAWDIAAILQQLLSRLRNAGTC
jgi:inhibitor of KinA sporulation pathway (predicted exonuclease)